MSSTRKFLFDTEFDVDVARRREERLAADLRVRYHTTVAVTDIDLDDPCPRDAWLEALETEHGHVDGLPGRPHMRAAEHLNIALKYIRFRRERRLVRRRARRKRRARSDGKVGRRCVVRS